MAAIARRLPFGLSRIVAPSFLGFAIINGFTFAVDLGLLSLCHGVLKWPYAAAVTLSYLTAFALSFVLNRIFNFRSHEALGPQTTKYVIAVALNYGVFVLGVGDALTALGVEYQLARVLSGLCEGVYMYCVMRWVVFRGAPRGLRPADDEDGGVDLGWRAKGTAGHGQARGDPETARAAGGVTAGCVTVGCGALQDQVGGSQPGTGRQQQPEQWRGLSVRRAGHDAERAGRQPQRGDVGGHHGDLREPGTQPGGPAGMQLDRDDAGAGRQQRSGQRAVAGAEVQDELAGVDTGRGDDARGPVIGEPVPSPGTARMRSRCRRRRRPTRSGGGGHGAGPSRSNSRGER